MDTHKHNERFVALAEIDRVIHEPARLSIVAVLYGIHSADFTFLMAHTGLSWGNLSSHMSKLENAGLIEVEKGYLDRRPHTMLNLTEAGRTAFRHYRQTLKLVLDEMPE